ncbi:6-bladed beta-propeller, partial [Gemmatimonadota bacterium]
MLHLKQDTLNTESLLFRPGQFTRGPDESYYVIDSGNHRVAVFDEQGEYQRSFGSEGGGPGAYRSMGFKGLHDGILHIRDVNMRRTTRVNLDGTVIEVLSMPRPQVLDVPNRYRLSDGRQLLLGQLNVIGEKRSTQYSAATIVNAEFDTLFHTTTEPVVIAVAGYIPSQPNQRHGLLVHFPGYPCSAYSSEQGIFLSDGRHPLIHRYNSLGEYIGRIELDIPPESVPAKERRWLIDRVNRQIREQSGIQREISRMKRDLMTITDPKGYWAEMNIDDAGYIWLSVVENWYYYDDYPDADICDIFSPIGEYLGRTVLPFSFDKCVAVDGHMCVMHRDEETGEYDPIVYQIVPAVMGL